MSATRVTELWRYPVKSMRGERVDAIDVRASGVVGDRRFAVVDVESGKVGSAKHPRLWGALLQCAARTLDGGAVAITLPDGSTASSDAPDVDDALSQVFGRPVRLTDAVDEPHYLSVWPELDGVMPDADRAAIKIGDDAEGTLADLALGMAAPGTFLDVAPLHVVTTATVAEVGDVRRLRPNVVVDAGPEPFGENGWTTLALGAVEASVLIPTMRCIMTTLAQADLPRDNEVLRSLTKRNRVDIPNMGTWSCAGSYATVSTAGTVRVGDDFRTPA